MRCVVPRKGTWIETGLTHHLMGMPCGVVPRKGTWIETSSERPKFFSTVRVVPRKGTWIETDFFVIVAVRAMCRPPQGDVD